MFEHASVAPSNNEITTGQTHRIIPAGLILPPPALLWEWLSYIYQTTGEWWRPPVKEAYSTAKPDSNAPKVAVPFSLKEFSRPTQPGNLFPKTSSKTISRTDFDYRTSRYYEEAGRPIEQTANLENVA